MKKRLKSQQYPGSTSVGKGLVGSRGPWSPGSSLLAGSYIFVHPFLGPRGAKRRAITCRVPLVGHALAGLAVGDQAGQKLAEEDLLPLPFTSAGGEREHPPMAVRAGTSGGGWRRGAQGRMLRSSSALVCASRAHLAGEVPPERTWGCLGQGGRSGLDVFGRFGSHRGDLAACCEEVLLGQAWGAGSLPSPSKSPMLGGTGAVSPGALDMSCSLS